MKGNLLLLSGVMLLAASYTWYADFHERPDQASVPAVANTNAHAMAPNFEFRTLDGKNHSLSDFKGKPVVLNFWATWCAPCVVEFPQMVKLAAMKNDAVFLFISVDDSKADIEKFLKKYGQSLPQQNVLIGWDKDKAISQDLYQTFKLPETYLINASMELQEKIIGADVDWASPTMQQKIEMLRTP